MHYYINKNGNTIGPCSIKDIRAFLHYGSIKLTDTVQPAGTSDWQPLSTLEDLTKLIAESQSPSTLELLKSLRAGERSLGETTKAITKKFTTDKSKPPPRIIRYQNYDRVPQEQRSAPILWQLLTGFLFFPPRLWRAASTVFSSNIYLKGKDSRGYHRTWPRWVEIVIALMIVINALAWCIALTWAYPHVHALVLTVGDLLREAWSDIKAVTNDAPR